MIEENSPNGAFVSDQVKMLKSGLYLFVLMLIPVGYPSLEYQAFAETSLVDTWAINPSPEPVLSVQADASNRYFLALYR